MSTLVFIPPIIIISPPSIDKKQAAAWLAFGNMVFSANPYEAGLPAKNTWIPDPKNPDAVNPPPTAVLVDPQQPGAEWDPPYMMDVSGTEMHEKVGQWKFKYADHYVARAIRIPYMYYKKSLAYPKTGVLVRDYFLVGFEGGMGY